MTTIFCVIFTDTMCNPEISVFSQLQEAKEFFVREAESLLRKDFCNEEVYSEERAEESIEVQIELLKKEIMVVSLYHSLLLRDDRGDICSLSLITKVV